MERVKSVLNYKKPVFWIILAVLIASVAAAVLFLTSPVNKNDPVDAPLGDYVSSRLVYLTPFSSALPADDSGFIYRFEKSSFELIIRDTGAVTDSMSSDSDLSLLWKEVPYSNEEWESMLLSSFLRDASPTLCENTRYMYLTDQYFLLDNDGELWLVNLSGNPKGAFIWSIYSIESVNEDFSWPEYTVTSGDNSIKATLISEYDIPALMGDAVEFLTIDPGNDTVPFRLYEGGAEKSGTYSIYDTFTGKPLDFVTPSGLEPQTYILQNAAPGGRYIVAVRTDDAYLAFGIRVQPGVVRLPLVPGELNEDDLAAFTSWFKGAEALSIRCMFLASEYEKPEDVDLYVLFREGLHEEGRYQLSEEELQKLGEIWDEEALHFDICKIPRAEMDRVLRKYIGIGLEDTNKVYLNDLVYLAEYDAYYGVGSDTNVVIPVFTSCTRRADMETLELRYYDSLTKQESILVLRPTEDGYQFVSNKRVD
ncbi:MAG: hypothetical protein II583_05590 [Oscillospiraceae bacterium]|nr:hypothetical protein [Oscillospiraceae bacterium]